MSQTSPPVVDATAGRVTCYACFRPTAHCYCGQLRPVANRTGFIILQHPRERFHPIGTARIAERSLERVHVEVDYERRLAKDPSALTLPPGTGVLFPGRGARLLEDLTPNERPSHLVVLDGTWHHASTLFRDTRSLHDLPRYAFRPAQPSAYRLRREPQRDYVSTVEAIAHCLRILEPETQGVDDMLHVFHTMIDRQVTVRSNVLHGGRVKRRRARPCQALPRALAEDYARLVVVYGESAAIVGRPRAQLVRWVAQRVVTGETFDVMLRPDMPLNDTQLSHMRLQHSDFDAAISTADFQQRWNQFIKADDILAAWNTGTLQLLLQTAHWPGKRLLLKAAYLNLRRGRGSLDAILEQENVLPETVPLRGRAAERLANAVTIVNFLHALTL